MPDDDFDLEPDLPELPMQPVTVQHPALGGDIQGEIEHRTADPAAAPGRYCRVFTVGMVGIPDGHPLHLANMAETLADATRRGLHPKGAVELTVSAETRSRRGSYTVLAYEVDVVPAVVDHDAASTVTPRDLYAAAAGG